MRAHDNASNVVYDARKHRHYQHQQGGQEFLPKRPSQTTAHNKFLTEVSRHQRVVTATSNESLASVIRHCGASLTAAASSPSTKTPWVTATSSGITMSMELNHFLSKNNFPFGKMQALQCKDHAE